jgi:ribosomal small subunit protein bTHX
MGRGDKKTAKGKRKKGSFGVSRSKNAIKAMMKRTASKKVGTVTASTEGAAAKPKKVAKKKADA